MSNYLLLFTIGPVKSFIQESRKSQDLFASSALLSHLCKTAIREAEKQFGKTNFSIITPRGGAEKVSFPNRFLAEVTCDENDFNDKAEVIKNKLIEDFSTIIIEKNGKKEILSLPEGAEKQLKNHLDIRWVFYPVTENYKEDFIGINKELASIKNANPFVQIDETGRKCIVDGKLNVKFYRKKDALEKDDKLLNKKLYQPEEHVTIYKVDDDNELTIWQLQKGEGVSAVTLKKRLFLNKPHEFPSTAYVSLMRLINDYKEHPDFKTFKDKVQNSEGVTSYLNHSNDQLFYKDNIERIFLEEGKTKKDINTCIKEHENWSKNIPQKHFTAYYALIRFDGDTMGDWFQGKFLKDGQDLKEFQKQLSFNIGNFSNTIQRLIKEPQGRVVYAGGEDFMAFVNIHFLEDVVHLIRCKFKELIVNEKLKKYLNPNSDITLSMGICIAHYKEPLQLVLDKTAKMEKTAKESGRNRFAIQVSKHSGTQTSTVHLWHNFIPVFELIKSIKQNDAGSAFLLNIYDFCQSINFSKKIDNNILLSKCKLYVNQAKTPGVNKTKIDAILNNLHRLLIDNDIKNFANTLLIIDFLQRQYYV